MYVLGIETSCDETAASLVEDGRSVLSNIISSSLKFHQRYGGIIPEIASRMQLETITAVVDSALKEAGLKAQKEIGLIAFTESPGLPGSLLVGSSFAKAVALSLNIPLLAVDHLHGHIYAACLKRQAPKLPFVALIVSGGHTSLFWVENFSRIKLLGATADDACGEAFDKVAKILGLGYPGGPYIEKAAKKGDPKSIKFNCSNTQEPLNFSFSGIKTAVLYYTQRHKPGLTAYNAYQLKANIAASFQEATVDVLINKSLLACRKKKTNRLVVGGGVAANNRLREKFFREAKKERINLYFAAKEFCTDNAAMVAGLGYSLFKKGGKVC